MSDRLAPVLGDPFEVSIVGSTLTAIAADVQSQAARLRLLAAGDPSWAGTASSAARARTATLPPLLDKADASYAAAGGALSSYARSLAAAQGESLDAIAQATRATADLAVARSAQAAAAVRDAQAAAAARTANLPVPMPVASRYEGAIEEAQAGLAKAYALNAQAHDDQETAARAAAAALRQASHIGIHNASWVHHITHAVGSWAAAYWTSTLRELSRAGNVVAGLAGLAALTLAVAGIFFPPLEVAASVLETVSLVGAAVATVSDSALAATGNGSWTTVAIDAASFAPAGFGKIVTKAAPALREGRLLKPTTVVHANTRVVPDGFAATGQSWGDLATLEDHVGRHAADFGYSTASEYTEGASNFLRRGLAERLPARFSAKTGTIRMYDRESNTFGSYNLDGSTKTYFKPDVNDHPFETNWDYWLSQRGRDLWDDPR